VGTTVVECMGFDLLPSGIRCPPTLDSSGTQRVIANLGHGMHPDHDPEMAAAFVAAVQELSAKMNERAA